MASWGKFTPNLEDMARLMMLPMFGVTNSVGMVLEGEDKVKLKYLSHDNIKNVWKVHLCYLAQAF